MGNITKPNTYVTGTSILASEVNANEDAIINEFNGNIDNANLKAGAGIALTKLDDTSSSDANARVVLSPGTSASPTKATDAEDEIQQLRYKVRELTVGSGDSVVPQWLDSSNSAQDAGWQEPPICGPNLLANPRFAARSLIDFFSDASISANPPPDNWSLNAAALGSSTADQAPNGGDYGTITAGSNWTAAAGDYIEITKSSNPTQKLWVQEVSTTNLDTVMHSDITWSGASGWTSAHYTPGITLTAQAAPDSEGEDANEITMTAGTAAAEGIFQTLTGLRADTKYLVGARVKSETNAAHVVVSGGLGAGNAYQDFDVATSGASYQTIAGIVQTDSSGSDITVSIVTAGAASDSISVVYAFAYEMGTNPAFATSPTLVRVSTQQTQSLSGGYNSLERKTSATTVDLAASVDAVSGSILEVGYNLCIENLSQNSIQFRIKEVAPDGLTRYLGFSSYENISATTQDVPISCTDKRLADQSGTYTYTVEYNTSGTATLNGDNFPAVLHVEVR